jgi:hypothetical protein
MTLSLTPAELDGLVAATPGPSWWSGAIGLLFILGFIAVVAALEGTMTWGPLHDSFFCGCPPEEPEPTDETDAAEEEVAGV